VTNPLLAPSFEPCIEQFGPDYWDVVQAMPWRRARTPA
jgi:hypothetical protein